MQLNTILNTLDFQGQIATKLWRLFEDFFNTQSYKLGRGWFNKGSGLHSRSTSFVQYHSFSESLCQYE